MPRAILPIPRRYLTVVVALLSGLALAPVPAAADRASARKLVEDARVMAARGDDGAVASLCERAIAQDPDYLPAYELVAPVWLESRRYGVVIRHFERLTLRDPGYAHGWYTLAYAYRLAGKTTSAIAVYELYIEMRPDRAEPYFGLALSYKKAGRRDDARRAFERYVALERDPARRAFVDQAAREIAALAPGDTAREQPSRGAPTGSGPASRSPAARSRRDTSGSSPGSADRPDRSDRLGQAGQPGPIDLNHPRLERSLALIRDLRYSSAEAILDHFVPATPALGRGRMVLRARLLLGRGRVREAAGLLVELAAGRGWWNPAVFLPILGVVAD